jgi:hypothetical protein
MTFDGLSDRREDATHVHAKQGFVADSERQTETRVKEHDCRRHNVGAADVRDNENSVRHIDKGKYNVTKQKHHEM